MTVKFLKGFNVTLLGDFGEKRSFSEWQKWVSRAGGSVSQSISDTTTHVMVADEAWIRKPKIIIDALEQSGLPVLTQSWLADSLSKSKAPPKKRFPAEQDLRKQWETQTGRGKQKAKGKRSRSHLVEALGEHLDDFAAPEPKRQKITKTTSAVRAKAKVSFTSNKELAARVMGNKDLHVFVDNTGFAYDIVLFKIQSELNLNQKVYLKLWESDVFPHTYAVTALHLGWQIDSPKTKYVVHQGTSIATALRGFKDEFLERTGVPWDQRLESFRRQKAPAPSRVAPSSLLTTSMLDQYGAARISTSQKKPTQRQMDEFNQQMFTWLTPVLGDPEGVLPPLTTVGDNGISKTWVRIPQWWNVFDPSASDGVEANNWLLIQNPDGTWGGRGQAGMATEDATAGALETGA